MLILTRTGRPSSIGTSEESEAIPSFIRAPRETDCCRLLSAALDRGRYCGSPQLAERPGIPYLTA